MSEFVCEREFKTERDGVLVPIVVGWRLPKEMPTVDWRCDYEIFVSGVSHRRSYACGVDSAQALQLAMSKVATELLLFPTSVFWFDPDDDLGLPVASSLADIVAERARRRDG